MQAQPTIAIRMADQADIDVVCASAAVGESAAIEVNGKLVGVADEYGTVTAAPGLAHQKESLERLLEAAIEVWPAPAARKVEPDSTRGWIVLEHWTESGTINTHGPYGHEPFRDQIHRIVLDLFDSADLEGCKPPKPSGGFYYSAADLPEHVKLHAVQLGEPFQL